MKAHSITGSALLATAVLLASGAARAQIRTPPPVAGAMIAPPTPDADALGAEMRVLAANPKDVEALTRAGELTLKLGDPTAAANLFARADKIEPNNPVLKADEAAVLVHLERPGEALRLFQQAVTMGADPASFAAERGLAYDLIGQQERAQRDYRLALQHNPDDAETIRRYALSLGISGKRKAALDEIDPLVRRQDHAGWRDRAFILAMTGTPDQATKIATAMLPPSMAEGLAPFFDKLATLSPADRAFAVHFGDLQVTPERLADARMTPPLPPLAPEAAGPELAATEPPVAPDKSRKHHEKKSHRDRVTEVAANDAVPSAPAGQAPSPAPAPIAVHVVTLPAAPATVPLASAPTIVQPTVRQIAAPKATAPAAAPVVKREPEHRPVTLVAPKRPASSLPAERPANRIGEEDQILANIVAGVSSASEQEASGSMAPVAAPVAPTAAEKAKQLEAANLAAIKQAAAAKQAAEAAAAARRKAEEDKKAAAAKKAADEKAAAAKKAADEKAAAEKRAQEKEERANPSRIWVQVAGGADEDDLPKAWAAVKAKAPDAFKGKSGWTTPLRATNRVLAGPFKSDAAAQDFINDLAKKKIHAFAFTSDKGQKVDKLPAK